MRQYNNDIIGHLHWLAAHGKAATDEEWQELRGVSFTFFSVTNNGNISNSLNVEPQSNGFLLSINNNDSEKEISNNTKKTVNKWRVEIYNTKTCLKILDEIIDTSEYVVTTTDWEPGMYIIRAVVDGEVLNQKIVLK